MNGTEKAAPRVIPGVTLSGLNPEGLPFTMATGRVNISS
jgi:hypothetical protein